MAASALEAKMNKIRQQNEEIIRRYEEVEEDKKNAAKLNALVQMVPSTDWPERKEPPEFFNPPRTKQKSTKEKHEYVPHVHPGEGKKGYAFVQGEGPPPDPKYNFLADSEREECNAEYSRENMSNRGHNKMTRGNFRKKIPGRDVMQKDNKIHKGNHKDEYQPGYEAWRAERNRIDEDRISRQRTAAGNWRREWDNDKMHIVDDVMKTSVRPTLGDFAKKDHKDYDRRYHSNGNDYPSHNRGNHRPHRGQPKSFHSNYDNRSHNTYDQHRHSAPMMMKAPLSPTSDERTVTATDKSIKVTLNQSNVVKGQVMSVKVSTPSIAGTGRVGPRQRTRTTYRHSDAEGTTPEIETFSRQKSFDDKSKASHFNNQKSPNIKRTHSQKKKDVGSKSPYLQRKHGDDVNLHLHNDKDFKSYPQKDNQKPYVASKSPRATRKDMEPIKHDPNISNMENEHTVDKLDTNDKAQVGIHDVNTGDGYDTCSDFNSKMIENNETESNNSKVPLSQVTANVENDEITPEEGTELSIEIHESNIPGIEEPKEEAPETAPVSSHNMENIEHITKDTNKDNIEVENECSTVHVNNLTENPQEKLKLSSNELVSAQVQSEEDLAPLESNNLDNIIKIEDAVMDNKDDQRSSEEVSELPANDNCDNIKEKATDERSSEAEKCSVIEAIDQPECTNDKPTAETVKKELTETVKVEIAEAAKEEAAEIVNVDAGNTVNEGAVEAIKEEAAETIEKEAAETIEKEAAEAVKEEAAEAVKEEAAETVKKEAAVAVKEETVETIKEEAVEAIKEEVVETVNEEVVKPVKEEPMNTEERTDKSEDTNECGNNEKKDIVSCSEVKSENTVDCTVNVEGNLEDKLEAPKESVVNTQNTEESKMVEDLKD